MIRFILNNQEVFTDQSEGSTVLDYVRYHKRLAGTKIGCREGDCGACTILVGDFDNEQLVYRSMTCCLMPLRNANGKHIVTVEGINLKILSPVQQAMVDTNGTQCGFCTPGFIVSLTGFVLNANTKKYDEAIEAIDGNICRCTGYKSIERAAKIISEKIPGKPETNTLEWLVKNAFVPAYFAGIENRLRELKKSLVQQENNNETGSRMIVSGGTDLVVQKPLAVKKAANHFLFDVKDLKKIFFREDKIHLGASVTVTDFVESDIIQKYFQDIKKYIKLISSTPIRNMATLGGNLVNASPIGDMTIFFLALDADIVLTKNGNHRTIKLKDFYQGYKQLDKDSDEIIETIVFTPPQNSLFNFEKVSKRTHLDIASVNTAYQIKFDANDTIAFIHLSAGGIAPFPKYLSETCAFLTQKKLTEEVIREALTLINKEIAPISDARGTANYKRLLLRQLFLAHLNKFSVAVEPVKRILLA